MNPHPRIGSQKDQLGGKLLEAEASGNFEKDETERKDRDSHGIDTSTYKT